MGIEVAGRGRLSGVSSQGRGDGRTRLLFLDVNLQADSGLDWQM
jgi:hypothetical protein